MFATLDYTATGALSYSYDEVDCANGNTLNKSADFTFLARGTPGYTMQRRPLNPSSWYAPTGGSNPYANNNISGGLLIEGSGSVYQRSYNNAADLEEITEYQVTWASLGSPDSNFVSAPDSFGPVGYEWLTTNSDYNCDEEERCMALISQGGVVLPGAPGGFPPGALETLSVAFRITKVGSFTIRSYDGDGNIISEETFPIEWENTWTFPYTHMHVLDNNRLDCDSEIAPYFLAQGNTRRMVETMLDSLESPSGSSVIPNFEFSEDYFCDPESLLYPHTRRVSYTQGSFVGPCVLSTDIDIDESLVVSATATSIIEEWGAANCPTP